MTIPPVINDAETQSRAMRLRRIMRDFLADQTPQERDRMMQLHLAQARGPAGNAAALRHLMEFAIALRKKGGNVGEWEHRHD